MSKNNYQKPQREQVKGLNPKDDVQINEDYFGDDHDRATQIVRNYNYSPNK